MNTDKRIEHTPLWFDEPRLRVKNTVNDTVAKVYDENEGREIVKACNHFYEMREALEEAKSETVKMRTDYDKLKNENEELKELVKNYERFVPSHERQGFQEPTVNNEVI